MCGMYLSNLDTQVCHFPLLSQPDFQSLLNIAISQNKSQYLSVYLNRTDVIFVGLDTDSTIFIGTSITYFVNYIKKCILVCSTSFALILYLTVNLGMAYLSISILQIRQNNYSARTLKSQRHFTYMIICQVIYPTVAMIGPTMSYVGIFAFGMNQMVDPMLYTNITALLVIVYPVFSVLFSFCFIRSYRQFLLRIIGVVTLQLTVISKTRASGSKISNIEPIKF